MKKHRSLATLGNVDLNQPVIELNGQTFIPLIERTDGTPVSLMGVIVIDRLIPYPDPEKIAALNKLTTRAVLALRDRAEQEQLFASLEMLTPQVSVIQDLLASSRKAQGRNMNGDHEVELHDLENWTKDALSQIWGGPKLLQNPILQLNTIQTALSRQKKRR